MYIRFDWFLNNCNRFTSLFTTSKSIDDIDIVKCESNLNMWEEAHT